MTRERTLKVTIVGDAKDADKAFKEIETSLGSFERRAQTAGANFGKLAIGATAVAAAAGVAAVAIGRDLVGSYFESERAGAKLDAVLRATGNTLGTTREEMLGYSSDLQRATGISDEAITDAQSLLLTFKEIGPEAFRRTTEAALDMSVVFGGDVSSSAIQLGKALNDPVTGISALARVGITFSEDQEKMIKKLVETNDVLGAQKIILGEVEAQVGGTARAIGDTGAGKVARFMGAVDDMKESLGEAVADGFSPLLDRALEWSQSDEALQFTKDFAEAISGASDKALNLADSLKKLGDSTPVKATVDIVASMSGDQLGITALGMMLGFGVAGPKGALAVGAAGVGGSKLDDLAAKGMFPSTSILDAIALAGIGQWGAAGGVAFGEIQRMKQAREDEAIRQVALAFTDEGDFAGNVAGWQSPTAAANQIGAPVKTRSGGGGADAAAALRKAEDELTKSRVEAATRLQDAYMRQMEVAEALAEAESHLAEQRKQSLYELQSQLLRGAGSSAFAMGFGSSFGGELTSDAQLQAAIAAGNLATNMRDPGYAATVAVSSP